MSAPARSGPRGPRVFDVGDVVRALERVIEEHTKGFLVRGELVNLRWGRDRRMLFFRLEDTREGVDARLDAFSFAYELTRGFEPADGAVVQAHGRLEIGRRDGALRMRLTHVEPAGEGELLREIAERRARLMAEGLFDPAHKRPLPFLPSRVGLVTARDGAALGDVRRRIEARCPVGLVVAYAAMQGPACAGEVAAALRRLDADPRVDVIVVARGGGSLQDLLPYSDEALVRAVAGCRTPVVSAVGHMRDTTLVCLAADRDAATPTAAADLVVPDRAELRRGLALTGGRLARATRRRAERAARELELLARQSCLSRPHLMVERPAERLALLGGRLRTGLRGAGRDRAAAVAALGDRRGRAGRERVRDARARLDVLGARLHGADPTRPLAAGFALVRDPGGRVVARAADARAAAALTLTFGDGSVPVHVDPHPTEGAAP